ncbi:MAG: hypothetical protein VYD87_06000 [Pseudomonadota bacterium]|nr:hypothetical protein [Pseudomonadota bacterium]
MTAAAHDLDAARVSDALPVLPAEMLERLALAVSARLRGRLAAAEIRIDRAESDDARMLAEDAVAELVWLLGRIDLHVAIARDRRGEMVEIDPALHDVLTAKGKLAAFPSRLASTPPAFAAEGQTFAPVAVAVAG